VVLRDAHVEPRHLSIEVSPDGLSFTAGAQGWSIGDAELQVDQPHDVPHSTWHEALQLNLEDTVLEVAWAQAAASSAAQTRWRSLSRWWPGGSGGMPRRPVLLALGGVAVLGLLVTLVQVIGGPREVTNQRSAQRDPFVTAEKQLRARVEWVHVALARDAARGAELRGHVERRDELEGLLRVPEVAALAPNVRVIIGQDLRRQIQDLAGDDAISVSIEAPPAAPAGRASGAATADPRPRALVAGTTTRAGVASSLRLLNKEFGDRIEIVDRTVYAPNEGDRKTVRVELPFRIASVNVSEGYIESSDGARYFAGATISGYVVEAIEPRKALKAPGIRCACRCRKFWKPTTAVRGPAKWSRCSPSRKTWFAAACAANAPRPNSRPPNNSPRRSMRANG
jgi:hypothetical protein